jgi:hypothetical protein
MSGAKLADREIAIDDIVGAAALPTQYRQACCVDEIVGLYGMAIAGLPGLAGCALDQQAACGRVLECAW